MNVLIRSVVGLGLVALIAGPASAQGQRGFYGRGGNPGMLLGNASVQQELKLDDKQIEKAKELAEKLMEKQRDAREALQNLEGEERLTKMREIQREVNAVAMKEMGAFLKPEQVARLKQISLQQRGAQAFSDAEVAQKLNLTESQKNDIRQIAESAREKMPSREDFQSDREAAMKKMAEVNKEILAQVTAKLNDEQRKTWTEMLGSPFEVKYEPRNN